MVSLQAPRDKAPPAAPRFVQTRIVGTRFASLLGLALLGGCAAGDYPSLQRWPTPPPSGQEATQPSGQMAAPPAPAAVTPHIAPGCDASAADSVDAEFRAALPATETAMKAASGTTPGTPGWSKGNIALASLQQIRARLSQLLAPAIDAYTADTIDHAQDDARDGPDKRPEGATLAACQAHVGELTTREDEQIDRLHALLPD